ncbi:hypothetical protein HNQ81_003168 [Desulfoprunum benzoelyticum]|uniref:Uncharacterized protein n=1 Tax=Desulfoprunum benzoelyticum TaxID=1506996 RepID=A0A840V165_9BACT|nr:hypothetical protein [Desulfoprunum benzoelyticum]
MSTILLYQGFGICGYRSTWNGNQYSALIFSIEKKPTEFFSSFSWNLMYR